MDSMIFDLDGTLWDSRANVAHAWSGVLKNAGDVKDPVTAADLSRVMGLQIPEIGKKLFGYLEEKRQLELMEECCRVENQYLIQQGGQLYPKVEEVLKELAGRFPLFIVSNCQDGYIEAFFQYHGLGQFFSDYENPGRTGLSKGQNIRLVMERNQLASPVYVGDTQGDCDAAAFAGIPFVYAAYGFGEADRFDAKIDAFVDVLELGHPPVE